MKEDNLKNSSGLYVLKHKDLDVAMVKIDSSSGLIKYILEIYLPEELPIGCLSDGKGLEQWWRLRAIPNQRKGIQQILNYLEEETSQSLMLSAYGLSLTDHYWMQPLESEIHWNDVNFYENVFSDELGDLLTDSQRIDINTNISKFSPSSSISGEMKKKWVLWDDDRYLMKVNVNHYGQQSVNEVIATSLYEKTNWKNYVPYQIQKVKLDGMEYPCSINKMFTSEDIEFVSAYQLIANYKVPNNISTYEVVIQRAVEYGLSEREVRNQLEYTILTDFLLTNTDRHFNNFGFLYDAKQKKFVSMAPLFDAGNSLFFERDIIPVKVGLLDVMVNSFVKREVDLLKYVTNPHLLNLEKLKKFPEWVQAVLEAETTMPKERAKQIALTVEKKMNYLGLFAQGCKIWKKEQYW